MRRRKLTKNLKINKELNYASDTATFDALDAASGKISRTTSYKNK